MANEDKRDFNAMLHDNKDMPKFQIVTELEEKIVLALALEL